MMDFIYRRANQIAAMVSAIVTLLVAFGVGITQPQQQALSLAAVTLVAFVSRNHGDRGDGT